MLLLFLSSLQRKCRFIFFYSKNYISYDNLIKRCLLLFAGYQMFIIVSNGNNEWKLLLWIIHAYSEIVVVALSVIAEWVSECFHSWVHSFDDHHEIGSDVGLCISKCVHQRKKAAKSRNSFYFYGENFLMQK